MDILFKSVLGGAVIGTVLLAARFLSYQMAGFIAALPFIFVLSYFFGFYGKSVNEVQPYLFNNFISALLTAILIGLFCLLNYISKETIVLNLTLSFGIYFLGIFLYQYFN